MITTFETIGLLMIGSGMLGFIIGFMYGILYQKNIEVNEQ